MSRFAVLVADRARPRLRRWAVPVAWSITALAVVLGVLAAPLLDVLVDDTVGLFTGPLSVGSILALSFTPVGALIVSHDRDNRIGWVLCTIGLTQAIAEFVYPYAELGLLTDAELPGAVVAAWFSDWIWVMGFGLLVTFLLLWFPTGDVPTRRWRPVAWLTWTGLGLFVASAIWAIPAQAGRTTVGEEIEGEAVAAALGGTGFLVLAVAAALSVASLIVRFRRSRGVERAQLKWFTFTGVMVVPIVFISSGADVVLANIASSIAIMLFPLAIGVAIVRHQLFDIDLIINRSVVYGTLTLGVVGIYAGVVTLVATLLDRSGLGASVLAAGTVAVLFQPARQRLQRGVDRLTYGHRDDPYAVISRVGQAVETSPDVDEVLPTIAETIAHMLRLPGVTIELDGPPPVAVARGRLLGEPHTFPLTTHAGTIGRLLVSRRSPSQGLRPDELRLVSDLARQAAAAARAVQLNRELQQARTSLVRASEEERRRLHRDLHDGLGPSLAAVAMQVQASRNHLGPDAGDVDRELAVIGERVQATIDEVRRIAHGLRPPALDELGLGRAVREQAAHLTHGLDIDVRSDELGPLPAAVELAAYRIVQEALTNVIRHAGAESCWIILRRDDALTVTVDDDGHGLREAPPEGFGISSMRQRAEEVGGRLALGPRPEGGTRVRATLPLTTETGT